jgi:hypothetical protein
MQRKIDSLIQSFVLYTENHHKATLAGDWREANKNARKRHKIFLNIIRIGDEAREALFALTKSEIDCIALMAATYSLKYKTEGAIEILKRLSKRNGLVGFEAQQSIKRWEEGNWRLE